MIKLSNRLKAAADLVTPGNVLADIGTDHGYLPIYLLEKKRISRAIAMDVNQGPLKRAKEHIRLFGMENYIEIRLSDGVAALSAQEADTILIAGMGGGLMMHIVEDGKQVCESAKELVLQPQSEIERLREYLAENGYAVLDEDMVLEDGKFYPIMRVQYQKDAEQNTNKELKKLRDRYGGFLLEKRHPVLKDYLLREQALYQDIYMRLAESPDSERIQDRKTKVKEILDTNRKALAYYRE